MANFLPYELFFEGIPKLILLNLNTQIHFSTSVVELPVPSLPSLTSLGFIKAQKQTLLYLISATHPQSPVNLLEVPIDPLQVHYPVWSHSPQKGTETDIFFISATHQSHYSSLNSAFGVLSLSHNSPLPYLSLILTLWSSTL